MAKKASSSSARSSVPGIATIRSESPPEPDVGLSVADHGEEGVELGGGHRHRSDDFGGVGAEGEAGEAGGLCLGHGMVSERGVLLCW